MTEDYIIRAMSAWYREQAVKGSSLSLTNDIKAQNKTFRDKKYVVIINAALDILKVYRIRPDGSLKGLRRWPADLKS